MKRKRKSERKNLYVNEKVEVRSEEEGFQGSWHQGTVIACDKRGFHVKYDYIVVDDGSDNLVDIVDVSPEIVDVDCLCENHPHYRGSMRRLPPTLEFSKWNLYYGICVDVWYKEAWWEGVVFDHEDGSEKRRVFFPDLGDEMIAEISDLRITQDWDDVEEEWHQRGTWLFLELIEQYEQEWYISISVEQLWYDLREKDGFQNVREWTIFCESLWEELVLEVIKDNYKIIVNHFLRVVGLPGSFQPESKSQLEPTLRDADVRMSSDSDLSNTLALVPFENPVNSTSLSPNSASVQSIQEKSNIGPLMCISNDDNHVMTECNGTTIDKAVCVIPEALLVSPSVADGVSCISSVISNEGVSKSGTDMVERRVGHSRHNTTATWITAGPDLLPKAESCPDAIRKYARSGKRDVNALITDVRKHLLYQGWKIEFKREELLVRMRYISPTGDNYYSLYKICSHLMNNNRELIRSDTKDAHHVVEQNLKERYVVEPEYCPQAVLNWSKADFDENHKRNFRRSEMILKAKKHLGSLGWEFHYAGNNRRRYLCYTSPRGRTYDSLREACKICIKEGGISEYDASPSGSVGKINVIEEVYSQLTSEKPCSALSNMDIQRKLICLDTKDAHRVFEPNIRDRYIVEPEYCPQAVLNWSKADFNENHKRNFRRSDMILKAKKHLASLGWGFHYAGNSRRRYLCYTSPRGSTYDSLREACKICIKEGGISEYDASPSGSVKKLNVIEEVDSQLASEKPYSALSNMDIQRKLICLDTKDAHRVFEPNIKDRYFVEPEYCPQAVLNWSKADSDEIRKCHYRRSDMTLKAKKHLLRLGWGIYYATCNQRRYLCYTSPRGRTCYSLREACKVCIKEGGILQYDASPSESVGKINVIEEVDSQLASEKLSSALSNLDFQRKLICSDTRNVFKQSRVVGQRTRKPKRRSNDSLLYLVADLVKRRADSPVKSTSISRLKGGKSPAALIKLRENFKGSQRSRVLRSTKRAQQVISPSLLHQNPRTLLSWLIDNNVVLPRSKVHYWKKKRLKFKGRITRNGVKCNCCDKIYTLGGFVAHGGSSNHRPAAKIFLEDGRSLLDCQREMMQNNKAKFEKKRSCRLTRSWRIDKSDNICSVCHYGGELIICDQCPSSFHKTCLGLESVPDGDWFCPSCCCGICGQSKLKEDGADIVDDRVLTCAQCEHKYHVGCIYRRGPDKLDICAKENWFCCKKCVEIFLVLHELLGRPIPVGTDNLTWTLVKSMQSDSHDFDASDDEAMVENYSKLSIALDVMHECFKPVKEPHNGRDLAADIIFSRSSELNRLNFRGFYTILLQRHDELITVANVRVHGEKVAEIPFIGTRFQYRRLGMCRILMDELEKKLIELGVRSLILPAVSNVLQTWTASFGFSKMSQSERLQFVDYTLLDFQGAIMCQKLLLKNPLSEYNLTLGSQIDLHRDAFENGENANADGSSSVSEVLQAIEENGFTDQGLPEIDARGGISNNKTNVDNVIMADQPTQIDHERCDSEVNPECSVEYADFKKRKGDNYGFIKFYKRRRTSVSRRYGYPPDSAIRRVNYFPGCS